MITPRLWMNLRSETVNLALSIRLTVDEILEESGSLLTDRVAANTRKHHCPLRTILKVAPASSGFMRSRI